MEFFKLNTAGDLNNERLCLVDDAPVGMESQDFRLSLGRRASEHFPPEAKIHVKATHPGRELPGLLGNTKGYLLLSATGKAVIEQLCPDSEIEYLPFALCDQRRKVLSRDYWFINPIGGLDCLDEEASGVVYDKDGDVRSVKALILDRQKLVGAPHLFRIAQDRIEYVISKTLGQTLSARGVTNVRGELLRITG